MRSAPFLGGYISIRSYRAQSADHVEACDYGTRTASALTKPFAAGGARPTGVIDITMIQRGNLGLSLAIEHMFE